MIIKIRQSHMRLFRQCERKYKLATQDGLFRLDKSPALSIGTAVHAGRAAILRKLHDVPPSEFMLVGGQATIESIKAEAELFPALRDREATLNLDGSHAANCRCYACAENMALATIAYYAQSLPLKYAIDNIEIHAIEQKFELVVAEYEDLQLVLTGTCDADATIGKQRLNWEFKTTRDELGPYFDSEEMSIQHVTYPYALQAIKGVEFYGTMLDVIRKPTKRVAALHDNRIISKTRQDYAEFQRDSFELLKRLAYNLEADYWPKNTDACNTKYGRCEYWDLCFSNFARYALAKYGTVETPLGLEEDEH